MSVSIMKINITHSLDFVVYNYGLILLVGVSRCLAHYLLIICPHILDMLYA